MDSDTLPIRWDGTRLSSSPFARHGWPRLSPSYAPPTSDAGPSRHASWRNNESATNESDLTSRSTSLHQTNGDSRRLPRRDRPINPAASRQSDAVPTQPVLVRAYSGNAEGSSTKSSNMPPRRLFPFSNLKSSAPSRPSGPPLPSDKDFSIESILQAIEPDIRGTLDSIADICGRSKFSLANEYGSHIAPLGEIRAPPGGLVPVEEATSSDERPDDDVVIFDEDPNIMEAGHDMHTFSFYRYLENLRRAASALERNTGPSIPGTAQPASAHPVTANNTPINVPEMNIGNLPNTREFVSRPKHSGRDLLAKATSGSGENESLAQNVSTPAVVSEVHLDAQANEIHPPRNVKAPAMNSSAPTLPNQSTWQAPDVIRSLLSWLKWSSRIAGPENQHDLQSAESRLRAMLQQSAGDGTLSPTI
ncbi:hypothetical protein N7478_005645 [Penicillium angulare]|uniref:uncharacterized protein n=1 Tax=Penicillium angulare TaxID=116970 RepID=UPI002540FB41|nr:uncharacterized protein N7478_005645 [Penicillium angulare]KAJ5280273.1 hypothetical protein N7478_005645 [Penicillium angulare]